MTTLAKAMRDHLSLIKYVEKYGVTKTAVKHKTKRQCIYR